MKRLRQWFRWAWRDFVNNMGSWHGDLRAPNRREWWQGWWLR